MIFFADFSSDKGAEDVETIKDHVVMGGDGEHEVYGLLVDGRRVGFLKAILALRVAEYNETSFTPDELAKGVVLALEVHFGLNNLASSWDMMAADSFIAVEVLEHAEFFCDGFEPERPVGVIAASGAQCWIGVGSHHSFCSSGELGLSVGRGWRFMDEAVGYLDEVDERWDFGRGSFVTGTASNSGLDGR